jgi:hypothetical protein
MALGRQVTLAGIPFFLQFRWPRYCAYSLGQRNWFKRELVYFKGIKQGSFVILSFARLTRCRSTDYRDAALNYSSPVSAGLIGA